MVNHLMQIVKINEKSEIVMEIVVHAQILKNKVMMGKAANTTLCAITNMKNSIPTELVHHVVEIK